MQFYQVSQTSLAKSGSSIVEEYIPIWQSDGTYISTSSSSQFTTFVQDGATSFTSSPVAGGIGSLFTLSPTWDSSQLFALEAFLATQSTSTCYCGLKDLTTNTNLLNTQVSFTGSSSNTSSVIRSPLFTLMPNHSYGLAIWCSNSASFTVHLSDASLIVFGQ